MIRGIFNRSPNRRTFFVVLAILINLVWASAYPLSKMILSDIPPLGLALWRSLGGAVCLIPFMRRTDFPKKLSFREIGLLFFMGLVGVSFATYLQFVATAMTLASNVSLIVALETGFIIVMAALFLKEKFGFRNFLSLGLGLAGALLLTVDAKSLSLFSGQYLAGNFVMLLSVICYASYTIFGKRLAGRWGTASLTAIPFIVSTFVLAFGLGFTDPPGFKRTFFLQGSEWWVVLFISFIGTGVTYLIWNYLLNKMSTFDLSRSLYVQPLFGMLLSFLILGESLSSAAWVGAGCVLLALAIGDGAV